MFFNKIRIRNYKCFNSDEGFDLDLRVPNGEKGSGLNILVGPNGVGKTAILESIDFLMKNTLSSRNNIDASNFNDISKSVDVYGFTENDFEVKRLWGGKTFQSQGIYFYAKTREKNSSSLVDPIVVDNQFVTNNSAIRDVEKRLSASGPYGGSRGGDLDVFYFDKNRTRHLINSNYRTQFEKVLNDFNFQFIAKLNEKDKTELKELANYVSEQSDKVIGQLDDKVIENSLKGLNTFFDTSSLRIDFIKTLLPFSTAEIVSRHKDELRQIAISSLGSGIEMITSLFLLDSIYKNSSQDVMYLIDEPELHLHPQFQEKLNNWLMEQSKTKQIVISTHSPRFISGEFIECITKLSKESKYVVDKAKIQLEKKDHTSFFPMHRDLFFTDKVVFLEGADDLKGYTAFCDNNEFEDIPQHFMQIKGKGDVNFFEAVCNDFGIKSYFIVDQDYLFTGKGKSYWSRKDRKDTIEALNKLYKDQNWKWNYDELMEFIEADIANSQPEKKDIETVGDGKKVQKIKDRNIIVLSNGAIEDYLDKETWGVINNEAKEELSAIFKYIKETL